VDCPVSTLSQVCNELGLSSRAVIRYFYNDTLVGKKWSMPSGRPCKPNSVNLIESNWKIDVKRIGKFCNKKTKQIIQNIPESRIA
jgi:hypothetical protein